MTLRFPSRTPLHASAGGTGDPGRITGRRICSSMSYLLWSPSTAGRLRVVSTQRVPTLEKPCETARWRDARFHAPISTRARRAPSRCSALSRARTSSRPIPRPRCVGLTVTGWRRPRWPTRLAKTKPTRSPSTRATNPRPPASSWAPSQVRESTRYTAWASSAAAGRSSTFIRRTRVVSYGAAEIASSRRTWYSSMRLYASPEARDGLGQGGVLGEDLAHLRVPAQGGQPHQGTRPRRDHDAVSGKEGAPREVVEQGREVHARDERIPRQRARIGGGEVLRATQRPDPHRRGARDVHAPGTPPEGVGGEPEEDDDEGAGGAHESQGDNVRLDRVTGGRAVAGLGPRDLRPPALPGPPVAFGVALGDDVSGDSVVEVDVL